MEETARYCFFFWQLWQNLGYRGGSTDTKEEGGGAFRSVLEGHVWKGGRITSAGRWFGGLAEIGKKPMSPEARYEVRLRGERWYARAFSNIWGGGKARGLGRGEHCFSFTGAYLGRIRKVRAHRLPSILSSEITG